MIKFDTLTTPYLIAEIGINHNGDLGIAKKLIDAANACSWDCVKFQKRNPAVCVPEEQKSVRRETPWGEMTYLEYKYRIEFGKEEFDIIDAYCREKPIRWTASVWDLDSLEFICHYKVPFLKIPSAKLSDLELIKQSALTKIPIILSTGMSTIEEIDEAVEILNLYASQFAIMHANSSYPAPLDEVNINCIPFLRERYKCMVGYSGHEYSIDPTVYAAVLGAMIIERHITIDHLMWGTDQAASVEPTGMYLLRNRIKDVTSILGDGIKRVTKSEIPIKKKLRG